MPHESSTPAASGLAAIIFDLDGVLISSEPVHWWAFRQTFLDEGREFDLAEYRQVGVGVAREEVIRRVLGHVSPEKLEGLMAAKERYVREYLMTHGLEPIAGAIEFVDRVRTAGLRTAVATASRTPRLFLEAIGVLDRFEEIIDRSMVERSKPYPDIYLLAAERLGLRPQECLVVEDSTAGVDAGRRAGMNVIAITTTDVREHLQHAAAVYDGYDEIPLDELVSNVRAVQKREG